MNHYERVIYLIAEANYKRAHRQLGSKKPEVRKQGRIADTRALQSKSVRRVDRALERQRAHDSRA